MTVSTFTKTDRQIQQDVYQELGWDSRVRATDIGVEVDKGIVTLTGTLDSYAKRLAAREAAHRVLGVLDVADDLEVKLAGSLQRTDTQIAQAARSALEWDAFLPDQDIRSTVAEGWVTLEGEVSTLRERQDAERVVRGLAGVQGVSNRLVVQARHVEERELRRSIEEALERRAEREAERIQVKAEDGAVLIEGEVRKFEKKAVLGAVSHAPGVREVCDRLTVNPWN